MIITRDNYYISTFVVFKACKRPRRQPDYISYYVDDYTGKKYISSEYWYGCDKRGEYVIRASDHWSNRNNRSDCIRVGTCIWNIFIPKRSKSIKAGEECTGKAYFKWFK
jgi:hypothetical protein